MKMRTKSLLIVILILGVCLSRAEIAKGASLNVDYTIYQPDASFIGLSPFPLQATVEFLAPNSFTGFDGTYDLYIRLTNISGNLDPGDFPATILLTGVGFDLPSGVTVAGGEMSLTNWNPTFGDPQFVEPDTIWGYDDGGVEGGPFAAFPSFFLVNTAISTLEASVDYTFGTPPGVVDGPDGGVLSAVEDIPNNKNYYYSSAMIGLDLAGTFDFTTLFNTAQAGDVVVAFGSPTAVVPEPATLLLIGSGLVGLVGFRRKFKKQ
jgi:hypothetical protein